MPDDPRYIAHARRADLLRRHALGAASRGYWAGYRTGMVRWHARDQGAAPDDTEARNRDALAEAALRGEAESDRLAWGCGYHDGQHWDDVTQHRGLLRLAVETAGAGSVRGLAQRVLGVDDASVRQMLAGTRPVPATRHAELLDLVSAAD